MFDPRYQPAALDPSETHVHRGTPPSESADSSDITPLDDASSEAAGKTADLTPHAHNPAANVAQAVLAGNPFLANRVSGMCSADSDVPEIHKSEFQRLTRYAKQLPAAKGDLTSEVGGVGVLILGQAGVGKSHLLSRFWRWSQDDLHAYYIFLHNVLASAERMPRYVLRSVVHGLAGGGRRDYRRTPLYSLLQDMVKIALARAGLGCEVTWNECVRACGPVVAELKGDRIVYEALLHFFRIVNMHEAAELPLADAAVSWLSGEAIAAEYGPRLGLPGSGSETLQLADDAAVEQVLIALTELARAAGRPFFVCFDQIDNLDLDRVKSLCRFLHSLVDHAPNLLLVASGGKDTLLGFRETGVIPEAVWDRMAQHTIELQRISPEAGRQILERRLQAWRLPLVGQGDVDAAISADPLFPLRGEWFSQCVGDALEVRPRDLLTWARQAWEAEQERVREVGDETWLAGWVSDSNRRNMIKPLPDGLDARITAKLEELLTEYGREPERFPPDGGHLAAVVEDVLACCVDLPIARGLEIRRPTVSANQRAAFDFELISTESQSASRTGLLFLLTEEAREVTQALKRLLQIDEKLDRLVLVTEEERRPIRLAQKGREYYEQLAAQLSPRFLHIPLATDEVLQLEAFWQVLGSARVGDLDLASAEGRMKPVSVAQAAAALASQPVFVDHPLLQALLDLGEANPREEDRTAARSPREQFRDVG